MTNEEISLYATEFRNRVLRGRSSSMMCVALSAPLMAALDAQGVACELQETGQYDLLHSFIKLDDGLVLDVTADQFNRYGESSFPPVYLGPPTRFHMPATAMDYEIPWDKLMHSFKRFTPSLEASQVGDLVYQALSTLPSEINPFVQGVE